ncbi:ATP-binding protein [Piscinibacter aquaticus]|uniref:ATP-binding protein n=1 Tax=Piscinibacter aquaticus TaxID=392597 RepID=A0A5C6U172_9BURK|nr:ATP-binding protein [Piscinibacter aquaticus]
MSAFVVALLGAESTGKTTLAQQLAKALRERGERVAVVGEYLREFCDVQARTPRIDEQRGIAAEQTRRIEAAAQSHDIVIADTTALMIAVYSDQVFEDLSLYDEALSAHSACQLTLLTALDLPWQADGHQRDGPHVREPVDAKVRAALDRASLDCSIVFGHGDARLANALAAIDRARTPPEVLPEGRRWRWVCERCGDADCERHWLPSL